MRTERNFKIEIIALLAVIGFAWILHLNKAEFLWLILASFLVLITEMLNTSLERLTDLVTQQKYVLLAKQVKDVAAAAVLVSVLHAIIVGCSILIPSLIKYLCN